MGKKSIIYQGLPFSLGMNPGMISPGMCPPGPSPLPHFGAAFGRWESPSYSSTSYRHHPATGILINTSSL